MENILNKLHSDFMAGGLKQAQLEGQIYTFLTGNQEKTCLNYWSRTDYEDFLSWFYPRLKRAINSYRDIGSSFDAFLSKYLLIASKEYRVRTVTNEITEYSTWCAQVPEMYAREEPPVYFNDEAEEFIKNIITDKRGKKKTKQVLALILKCYYYISEDFAEKAAPIIGIGKNELLEMLKKIRSLRQERDDKLYILRERVYRQFYRCLIYDKRLSLTKEDTAAYIKLNKQQKKARQCLEKMRNRMARTRTEATNIQVAEVIGLKKGTVDSSLFQLKLKLEHMSGKAKLN
ncbi:MAG: hypothetical protein FWD14_02895 [Treponema sp.]|nr:hypothetical protein [Treponema sp.]